VKSGGCADLPPPTPTANADALAIGLTSVLVAQLRGRGVISALVVGAAVFAVVTSAAPAATATSVPVRHCPTSSGAGGPAPSLPRQVVVSAPSASVAGLAAFANGYLTVLAPSGWHCSSQVGGDGSVGMTVAPSGSGTLREPAITAAYFGTSGEAAEYVCDLFAAADGALPVKPCPKHAPTEELITHLNRRTVAFEDPAGVSGDGAPSGGADPANGVRVFVKASASAEGYALGETCTLPETEHALCTVVLDNFLSRNPPHPASHA
jgi:hypothetical protein